MPSLIRSVFLSSYTGLGGGETSLLALLGALDRKKHIPVLICPKNGPLPEAAHKMGMETRVLPYRGSSLWFVPSVWGRFPAAKRIEAALRELSPSVVHSDFHTLPYAVAACRHLSVPVIFTCYGWWFRPRPWQRAFYRRGPRAILAISEAVKRGFLGKPPFMAPDQVQVLHLGVDTEQFCPRPEEREAVRRELQLPLQAPLVTLLARFQAVKGHDIFLGAARQVACRLSEARFVIAGENVFGGAGDEAFKRRMLAQADADPVLRDRVRFTGWVARSDRLLAASDVVVCSSRFESFGMVLLEAMSSAVPVVSTNVGGPTEIVDDGATGYLVPPGRPDLIAERVLALLQDAELHRRLGLAARGAVKERFELRRYAAGFSKVLEALAADQAV